MPRLNQSVAVGLLLNKPTLVEKDDRPVQCSATLKTLSGRVVYSESLETGDDEFNDIQGSREDKIYVLTPNPIFAEKMFQNDPNDLIVVKGSLRSQNIIRKYTCKNCNHPLQANANRVSLYPLMFNKIGSAEDDEKPRNALRKWVEMGNTVTLIGVICEDLVIHRSAEEGSTIGSFPLAVKRTYFIPEDDMRVKADFFYIKMYKNQLREYENLIHAGQLVLVDGRIQTRMVKRRIECPICGEKSDFDVAVSEIVPYSIEILKNSVSDDPVSPEPRRVIVPQTIGDEADIDLARAKATSDICENGIVGAYRPTKEGAKYVKYAIGMSDQQ